MGSIGELRDAVKETLAGKGVLQQLQAHLRSEVYKVLLDAEDGSRPEPSNENLIMNELIREYLIYNGYRDTLSVFIPETGQPAVRPFDRGFLVRHLGMAETQRSQQVPLLYSLLAQQKAGAAVIVPKQQKGDTGRPEQRQQQHQGHALLLEAAAEPPR